MLIKSLNPKPLPVLTTLFVAALSANVLAADKATIAEGKQIYNQNCSACHQEDAIGKPGFAPSLTNPELLSIASSQFFEGTIRDGRMGTGMPPFAHLGEKKIKSIVAFLQSHAKRPNRSKAVDAQPASKGDKKNGANSFAKICSTCHGDNGDGYAAGSTGTAIGLAGVQQKVSDGFIRETIKYGRSNTRMLGFSGPTAMANLSNQEIDDIIVYMRTLVK
jgi:cytochrome c oxidase cbb3-type subunit 3